MPTIEVSDKTFRALQDLAQAFVDTPDDVVWRLISGAPDRTTQNESTSSAPSLPSIQPGVTTEALEVDPLRPEDLTHTRISPAFIDGEVVHRPNWNRLVQLTHVKGFQSVGSIDALRRITKSNILAGEHEDRGYVYVPEAEMSIQGVDARLAWENTIRVAKYLQIPIAVEFEWHNKEKAAHPGRVGSMTWGPQVDVDGKENAPGAIAVAPGAKSPKGR